MSSYMLTAVLIVFLQWHPVRSSCPHNETGIASFAELFGATNSKTGVNITSRTLLDQASVDVSHIVISGDGALIFQPGKAINIRTKYIRIMDNGELIIGNDTCRFDDDVDIVLYGERTSNRSLLDARGEKGLTVEDNGSLKIYGKDKPSWTKLAATINMPSYSYRHRTDSSVNSYKKWAEGLFLTILNTDFTRKSYEMYDIWKDDDVGAAQTQVDNLVTKLNSVEDGEVVALAVQNFWQYNREVNVETLFSTIETLSGMTMTKSLSKLRTLGMYDAFALVFKKGNPTNFEESVDSANGKYLTHARAGIIVGDTKISSVSVITSGKKASSYIDVQVFPATQGQPSITLVDDMTGQWAVGDNIVIASTDYSWHHNEVRKIISLPSANVIQLDSELDYRHFGEIENGVDMRAEVGLLTRNIKIYGEMQDYCPEDYGAICNDYKYDTYGAHVKVVEGFNTIHIEGVEIFNAGAVTDRGFYAIHFHLCGNVTYKEAVVKRTSIHNSFRAVAVHGTFGASESAPGVEIRDNIAYNILGHAMFFEDGAEKANALYENFVVHVRKAPNDFFESDADRPSGYWISTPEVILKDNVAAGSEGFGCWHIFPSIPVGDSAIFEVYEENEAFHTTLYTIDNNVFHSNDAGGWNFDNVHLNENGEKGVVLPWDPRADPLDPTSPFEPATVYRIITYKNRLFGVWWRNGGISMVHCSFAESRKLLQFAGDLIQSQYVWNSVFVGESEANNEDDPNYPDAYGWSGKEGFDSYQGIAVYDGPVYINNCSFKGFKSKEDGSIVAGAISPAKNNKYASSPVTGFKNIVFEGEDPSEIDRVFIGNPVNNTDNGFGNYFDGNEAAAFTDYDGSIVGCEAEPFNGPYQIHTLEKFVKTDMTLHRPNWQAAYTTDKIGKVGFKIQIVGPNDFDRYNQMRRVNRLDSSDVVYEDNNGRDGRDYTVILNRTAEYIYEFQYVNNFPKKLLIEGRGVARNEDVLVGICLPTGTSLANIILSVVTPNDISHNNSDGGGIIQVDEFPTREINREMKKVFLQDRFLYVLFANNRERDPRLDKYDDKHCPGDHCPQVEITLDEQPTTYEPCFTVPSDEVNIDISPGPIEDCSMPAGTRDESWGAGDFYASRDGGWRPWGSWAECCNNEPDNPMQTTRTRTCDFPTPYGGGSDCSGIESETKDCEIACPVNGEWGQWSEWEDCMCYGDSAGVKSRTRSCSSANGGLYCDGVYEERTSCDGNCP